MAQFKKTPAHAVEGLNGLNLDQQLQDHETRLKGIEDRSLDHETRLTDLELRPHGQLEVGGHLASQIKSDADVNVPAASGRTVEDYLAEIRRARGGYDDLAARLSALSGKAFKRTWTYSDDFRDPANSLTNVEVEAMNGDDAGLRLSSALGLQKSVIKSSPSDWQRAQPKNAVVGHGLNATDNTTVKYATLRFTPVSVLKVRLVVTSNGGYRSTGGNSNLGLAELQAWYGNAQVTGATGEANLAHVSYPAANLTDGIVAAGGVANSYFAPNDVVVSPLSPVMVGLSFSASVILDRIRFCHTDNQTGRQPRDFEVQFSSDPAAQITDDARSPRWFGVDLSNGKEDGSEKSLLGDTGDLATLEATILSLPGVMIQDHFDLDTRGRFATALSVGTNAWSAGRLRLGNGTMVPHGMGLPESVKDVAYSLTFTAGSAFDATANSTCGFALQVRGYGAATQTTQPSLGYQFKVYAVKGSSQAKAVLQYWSGSAWVNAMAPVDVQGVGLTTGVTYTLKLSAIGNVFKAYVDGVQVLAWTDVYQRSMSGQAGFSIWGMSEATVTDFTLENQESPYGQRTNLAIDNTLSLAQNGPRYFTSGRWVSEPLYLEGTVGGMLKGMRWAASAAGVALSYRTAMAPRTQSYRNVALTALGASVTMLTSQPLDPNETPTNMLKGMRRAWDADGTVFGVDLRTFTPGSSGEKVACLFSLNGASLVSKVVHANVDVYGAKKVKLWAGMAPSSLTYLGEYDLTCAQGPGVSVPARLYVDEIRFKPIQAQYLKAEWTPNPNRLSGSVNASNQFNSNYLAIAAFEVYAEPVAGLEKATWYQLPTSDLQVDLLASALASNRWVQLRADLSGDGTTTPTLSSMRMDWHDLVLPASGSATLRLDTGSVGTRFSKLSYRLSNLVAGASGTISYRVGDVLDASLPWMKLSTNASYSYRNVAYAGNGGAITYLGSKATSSIRWPLYRAINGVDAWHATDPNLLNMTELSLAGSTSPESFIVQLEAPNTVSAVNVMGNGVYGAKQADLSYSLDGLTYQPIGSFGLETTASQLNANLLRFAPVVAQFIRFDLTPNHATYLDVVQLKVWGDGVPLTDLGRYLEIRADLAGTATESPKLLEAEVEYQLDPSSANSRSLLGLSIDLDRARFEFASYKQKRQYGLAIEDLDFLLDASKVVSWLKGDLPVYDSIHKCLTLSPGVTGEAIRLADVTGGFGSAVLMTHAALLGGTAQLQVVGVTDDPLPQTVLRVYDLASGIVATPLDGFGSCVRLTPTLFLTGSAQLKSWGVVHD